MISNNINNEIDLDLNNPKIKIYIHGHGQVSSIRSDKIKCCELQFLFRLL
jgi:hypothetical protein